MIAFWCSLPLAVRLILFAIWSLITVIAISAFWLI
jgi:hypothetical protein